MNAGDFLWYMIAFFFFIIYFMMIFTVIGDLFRSPDMSGAVKAIWIIALLFIPLLTMLLYVITRGSGMSERAVAAAQKQQAQQVEYANAIVAQQGGGKSAADQIAEAKKLHDSGAINDDEYAALKAKALA
jgi:hypothetical protein